MQLFIDTNIYLDYFRTGKDTLDSLKALKLLLRNRKLKLLVPLQIQQEYIRNRSQIVEATRNLLVTKKDQSANNLPVAPSIKDTAEAKKVREASDKVGEAYKKLIEKYDERTEKENTPADKLLAEIQELAINIPESKSMLDKAYVRYLKGHPPRKNDNSYGDAIIWETLLAKGYKDDLTIVTRDSDFIEKRKGKETLTSFLEKEWSDKTKKRIQLFISLGEFINAFEKKRTIKDEVIKKEKDYITYTGAGVLGVGPSGYSDAYNRNLIAHGLYSPGTGIGESSAWAYASPSTIATQPLSAGIYEAGMPININQLTTTVNYDKPKFCPYCGKEVKITDSAPVQYSPKICPYCHRQFRVS